MYFAWYNVVYWCTCVLQWRRCPWVDHVQLIINVPVATLSVRLVDVPVLLDMSSETDSVVSIITYVAISIPSLSLN